MASGAVPGFAPSRHGFHFVNSWPSVPAFLVGFEFLRIGIGDAGRGLCGGMAFAVRDRFERGELPPPDRTPPPSGTPLFEEVARRQLDSFDRLVVVPFRFWRASIASQAVRHRETAASAWPTVRAEIDAGQLAMVGLVRSIGWNPLHVGLGHQVAAFRYDEHPDHVTIGIYDPNHPDDDTIELRLSTATDGSLGLTQSSGEVLFGLLALPFRPSSTVPPSS
jgi:hypothetical protein